MRGKVYPIDIVSTMDHSWGPGPNRILATWLGETFILGVIWPSIRFLRLIRGHRATMGPLAHGYVMEDGKVYGLVDGKGRVTERDGLYTMGLDVTVEDIRGKTFHYTGKAMATYPWYYLPNVPGFYTMLEYEMDGRKAYGGVMDFVHMDYLL